MEHNLTPESRRAAYLHGCSDNELAELYMASVSVSDIKEMFVLQMSMNDEQRRHALITEIMEAEF